MVEHLATYSTVDEIYDVANTSLTRLQKCKKISLFLHLPVYSTNRIETNTASICLQYCEQILHAVTIIPIVTLT